MKVTTDKLIFVIGGTGAQGQAVVKALLEPSSAGAPSPYAVRILTRNPDHPEVRTQFNHPNIELVQGSFTDLSKVEHALEGLWGASDSLAWPRNQVGPNPPTEDRLALRIMRNAECVM